MKKLLAIPFVKQFCSYFLVGGVSAIIEWILFAVFSNVVGINYILATCLAFVFSTTANWYLGKIWTFKENKKYEDEKTKEVVLVFAVSGIGLLMNMGLMFVFVDILGLGTSVLKTLSKVAATGIVFIWNFFIRKFFIYR